MCTFSSKVLKHYINVKSVNALEADFPTSKISNVYVSFSKEGCSQDPTWMGLTDEVRVYDTALSTANINYLFEAGPNYDINTIVNGIYKLAINIY